MFTIGFVRDNEIYATLRGWLHLSTAQTLCASLNSNELPPPEEEVGRYDYAMIVEVD